jgi:hypothetical protein
MSHTEPYVPKHDLDGVPIADLSTDELKRRLNRLRGAIDPIEVQYCRAYAAALRERGAFA